MQSLRNRFQHRFNPLHVYCRLRDAGVAVPFCVAFCSAYERFVYRFLT